MTRKPDPKKLALDLHTLRALTVDEIRATAGGLRPYSRNQPTACTTCW
jgi:hypothetical protein